jgi:sugar O-acyltransferase (sialic acid O-acetyltransferase NeuD family)
MLVALPCGSRICHPFGDAAWKYQRCHGPIIDYCSSVDLGRIAKFCPSSACATIHIATIGTKVPRNLCIINSARIGSSPVTIVVYGAGGFAREVVQLVRDIAATGIQIACAGFLVDAAFRQSERVGGLPVLGGADWLRRGEEVTLTVAVGSPAARRRIVERIEQDFNVRFATLIHPSATIGDSVAIERGVVTCAGCVAMADLSVGAYVQLHVNCTIGHDVAIGDFVTVAPGANVGGAVKIGEGAFIGSGAVVLPRLKIGKWSIIGAGAIVTTDVPDNSTVVGVPAKVVSQRAFGWQHGFD